jgi:hypothetical protein
MLNDPGDEIDIDVAARKDDTDLLSPDVDLLAQ